MTSFSMLISTLPKNLTPSIGMVISDFLEHPNRLVHLILYVIKVTKPKGKCAMATAVRFFFALEAHFLIF